MEYIINMQPNPSCLWFGDYSKPVSSPRTFVLVGCVAGEPPSKLVALTCMHDVNTENSWIGHDPQSLWTLGKTDEHKAPPQSLTYYNLMEGFNSMMPVVLFLPIKPDHPALLAESEPARLRLMSRHMGECLHSEGQPSFDEWKEAHAAVFREIYDAQTNQFTDAIR